MAHGRSLELARIQPRDRVRTPMPPSSRRPSKLLPHTRVGPQRRKVSASRRRGRLVTVFHVWHTTQRRPWTVRAERRAAGKRQRAARKAARR